VQPAAERKGASLCVGNADVMAAVLPRANRSPGLFDRGAKLGLRPTTVPTDGREAAAMGFAAQFHRQPPGEGKRKSARRRNFSLT